MSTQPVPLSLADQMRQALLQRQAQNDPPPPPIPINSMPQQSMQPLPVPTYQPQQVVTPDPTVTATRDRLATDQGNLRRLQTSGSGIDQIANPVDASGNPTGQPVSGLRRFGGVLAKIGNVGAELALGRGAGIIPGTDLHHRMLVNQATGQVNNDLGDQEKQAQTTLLDAEPELKQLGAENAFMRNQAYWQHVTDQGNRPISTDQGLVTVHGNTAAPITANGVPIHAAPHDGAMRPATVLDPTTKQAVLANYNGADGKYYDQGGQEIANAQPIPRAGVHHVQPVTENGQPTFAYAVPGEGWYDVSGRPLTGSVTPATAKNASTMSLFAAEKFMHEAYTHNPGMLKSIGPLIAQSFAQQGFAVPPDLEAALSAVPEDQPLSPTTGNPIGTAMPSAPTGSTRTAAQNAQKFLDEYPRINQEVNMAANHLGPVNGRAVMGFLLGTVGSTGDPRTDQQLGKLRTDLTFVGSNAAKFHINSVEQAKQFDSLIAANKSTAPAIQGFLDSVKNWAETSAKQQRGYGEQGSGHSGATTAPTGADVKVKGKDGKMYWANSKTKQVFGVAQ
jgi:hypothetical protein